MSVSVKRAEWRSGWPAVLVAMLGIAGSSMWFYGQGVLMGPVTQELGWSRAQFSSAFLVQSCAALIAVPLGGRLVDRYGPRRVALGGIPTAVVGIGSIGLASGPMWQWLALAVAYTILVACIAPTVWISAVVGRFDASRGVAVALALAGVGLGMALWPVLTAILVKSFGWRPTFLILAAGWGLVMMPLVYFLLQEHGAPNAGYSSLQDSPGAGPAREPLRYFGVVTSPGFIFIGLAGSLFSAVSIGLAVHLVPLMTGRGISLTSAAGIVSVAGLASVTGRLCTGMLLDRMPTKLLAVAIFLLPVGTLALLWGGGLNISVMILAVLLLGLSLGAEIDLITYVSSRVFAPSMFASLYGLLVSIIALGASCGPLIASVIYDRQGGYDGFLLLAGIMSGVATISIRIAIGSSFIAKSM